MTLVKNGEYKFRTKYSGIIKLEVFTDEEIGKDFLHFDDYADFTESEVRKLVNALCTWLDSGELPDV